MKKKAIASAIAVGCMTTVLAPIAAQAKDEPAVVGVSSDKLDAMEAQRNVGAAKADCGGWLTHGNPQGVIKKGKTKYTSPLWCTTMYNRSPLFTEPMTLGTSLTYGKVNYAVGGDAATPPQFGSSMLTAPQSLGYDSNGAVPTEFYGFGRLSGIQGDFGIDSMAREVYTTFSNPSTVSGVSSVLTGEAKTLSLQINGDKLVGKNACRGPVTTPNDNLNSQYLRCDVTNSTDWSPGAALDAQGGTASTAAGAIGYGAWPVTFRILNYLPVPLDKNSEVAPSNILIEPKAGKSSSGSADRIAAAPESAAYPAQVGDWTVGGYRSSTANARYTKSWRAGASGDATNDATYQGLSVTINAEIPKGDNILNVNTAPPPPSGSPSPSPTTDQNSWCSVHSSADAQCHVTVTGGMNKVITFHILPFRK
ncbi:MAG: hypothetical protein WA988_03130 [Candidatus Nanopelagicales bacterium]